MQKKIDIPELFANNNLITDGNICNCFNDHFASIGSKIAELIEVPQHYEVENYCNQELFPNTFFLTPITAFEIKNIISKLKNKNNVNIDGLTNTFFKRCKNTICYFIADIANYSFERGEVPSKCKIARVVPVFKSGDKSDVNNYRPISILPVISRILEKYFKKTLDSYLKKYKFFN